jgi:hypothetical protein
MTTETSIESKRLAFATQRVWHNCCGAEAVAKSPNDVSGCLEHDAHAHAAPTKDASASCCCGDAKEL